MKKNIIIIVVLLTIVILLVSVFTNKKDNSNVVISEENKYLEYKEEFSIITNEFDTTIDKIITLYKESKSNKFSEYFNAEMLNSLMNNKIYLMDNIANKDFGNINVYDSNGMHLNAFPLEKTLDVDNNINEISQSKNYLIKIFSENSNISYYFKFMIDDNLEIKIENICYTLNEVDFSKVELQTDK